MDDTEVAVDQKQPEFFDRAERIGEYQDYINLRLTDTGSGQHTLRRSVREMSDTLFGVRRRKRKDQIESNPTL